ncbi:MAG: T9SS type A sorting domain-containing protein [Flavobacteriales bacterium]|nr:T9SS type A sorting domain-containing protein [Flavobacteriales bacterium]MCB9178388.1 T9SS type A sorting domain-containing protein [Flavobacteriales bacterium]
MCKYLRTLLLPFASIIFGPQLAAQDYVFNNCSTGGATNIYTPRDMAGAPNGSLYVVGSYTTGSFTIGGQSVTTEEQDALYLAKFTADLSFQWLIKLADNPNTIESTPMITIDVDQSGDLIVGIGFRDTLLIYGNEVVPADGTGIVLIKLEPSGEPLWWHEIDGDRLGKQGVSIDPVGNILVTGEATEGMFTSKYNTSGEMIWWTPASGNASSSLQWSVRSDPSGNVYTIGSLPAGGGTFGELDVDFPIGCFNVGFLCKYNSTGEAEWVRYVYSQTFGQYSLFNAITTQDGSIFVAGEYSDAALRFSNGGGTLSPQMAGHPRSFVARYDVNGSLQWVRVPSYNSFGQDGAMTLTAENGALHSLYSFSGTIDHGFGPILSQGYFDVLLMHTDYNGQPMAHFQISGSAYVLGNHILHHAGHLYVLGATNGASLTSPADCSVSIGSNMFILRFSDEGVGIPDQFDQSSPSVYPNPNNGLFTAQPPRFTERLIVSDAWGRIVLEQSVRSLGSDVQLDLGNVPSGVYWLRTYGQGHSFSTKVLVR